MKTKNLFLVTIFLLLGVVSESNAQNNTILGVNSSTPGAENILIGNEAGANVTNLPTVFGNILIGRHSGHLNSTGIENVFLGYQCALGNTTGSQNTFVGTSSGAGNVTGNRNSSLGHAAGLNSGSGDDNVNMGWFSGISGSRNTCLGVQSGYGFGNGNGNVLLGYKAGNITSLFNKSNILVIENGLNNTPLLYGEFDNKNIEFNVDKNSSSRVKINTGIANTSGLKFGNLNSGSLALSNSNSKFLSLNSAGDVILESLPSNLATGSFWSLTGNTVASDGSDFLGTVNDQDLVFKRYNIEAGRIGAQNTSFGKGSSALGIYNTAIGGNALAANTTSVSNVAVGAGALSSHTLNGWNTAIGTSALSLDDTGKENIALGYGAMRDAKGGQINIGIGTWALNGIIGGYYNTAIGYASMQNATSGSTNIAIGREALFSNINPTNNVVIGDGSYKNSTGNYNIGLGIASGEDNTTGSANIAIGQGASSTTGNNNILIGTSAKAATGSNNILIGQSATTAGIATNALNIGNVIYGKNIGNISSADGISSSLGIIGIGTNNPGNTLEVKSNTVGASGLRFTNLNSTNTALTNSNGKFLTLNGLGDVILETLPSNTTGNFWGLNGNAGTNPSTAITVTPSPATTFLGTTDDKDLVFRRFNTRAGVLSNGTSQLTPFGTSLGVNSALPAAGSVYIGNYAGFNTTGANNTFIGAGAGSAKVSGSGNVYIGQGVANFAALLGAAVNESDVLRIHNNNSNPLILGNFNSRFLRFDVNGSNTANNVVEISSANGPFVPTGRSGLRFQDYTINSNSEVNTTNKFLTLNGTGDVILMNLPPNIGATTITAGTNISVTGTSTTGYTISSPYQSLTLAGNQLSISNGNSVTLPTFTEVDGSVTNELQTLSQSGNTITLSNNGGSFTLPTDTDTDDQTLSIAGNVLTISEGNNVTLPTTSVIAGNNVTVTGTGTIADPFVVNSTASGTGTGGCNIYTCDGEIDTTVVGSQNPNQDLRTVTMGKNNLHFKGLPINNYPDFGKVYIGENTSFVNATGNYRLYVEGGILTEKVKVALRSGADWQDGVFAEDYKLMSLNEVDTFVKENKHLPGIESADELVKKGLDLGEMQAKQMGKIEELTLYAIEQNKAIEKQAKEIEELKAQVNALLNKK